MASFNVKFKSNDEFNASLQDSGTLDVKFGDTKIVETGDYEKLKNKPMIESHTLIGDKTFKELGLDTLPVWEIEKILYLD